MPQWFGVYGGSPLSRPPERPVGTTARVPFWDAAGAAFGPNLDDSARSADGRREEEVRAALWARHREAERLTGRKLPLAQSLTGEPTAQRDPLQRVLDAAIPTDRINAALLGRPGVLSDDDYEAELDKLRETTAALAGVETRAAMMQRLQGQWNASRGRADATADQGMGGLVGAFAGQTVGVMADPRQLGVALATGGWGAGRGLAARMLAQAGAGAGAEALAQPGKLEDARVYGGPSRDLGDAAADVAAGAVGGAVFEGAFSVGRAAWRALRPDASPAERGAAAVLNRDDLDVAALGDVTGDDFDRAAQALATGAPPPPLEPARDLADLFSPDAGGGPDVAMYRGRPIYAQAFDPAGLTTDPARFQYKAGGDQDGVTARLRGVEAWDPLAAGRVLIWEDAAGRSFVADGHQRFGLIRRLNDDRGFEHSLDGYLFRARDGWRAEDVRVVAALKNIREGSGSPLDAAKVFRDAPDALEDRSLPVTGEFIAQARGLAKLSEPAFRAVVNKVIDERHAAEIGLNAGHRPDLHENMVSLMKQAEPANVDEARALVVESLQDEWIRTEGDQTDLFGYDPSVSAMIGRAKIAAAVKRALARDAKLFNQLVRHADAIEAGGNALARDANQARLALDRAALEVSAKLALRHGPVGEAMAAAAARVVKGEAPGLASRTVLKALREALAAGERLDDLRGASIDPKPPTAQAEAVVQPFGDPAGAAAKAQAEPALEDIGLETGDVRAGMAAEIDRVLKAASAPGNAHATARLGEVSPWLAAEAKAAGLDLEGYAHVFDTSGVRHVMKNHGDPAHEANRGQVAVTDRDLRDLPELLAAPDLALFGLKDKQGKPLVMLAKTLADGSTLVLQQVRTGKRQLGLWSMLRVPGTIDAARLGKLADPNVRNDAGALKIVRAPRDASAVDDPAPPGLFDDLGLDDTPTRAREALIRCAPES